jgi:two-component system chemotaxis response regulator CheB
MPGAVAQAGFADEVLPLDRVAEAIQQHLVGAPAPALTGGSR